MGNNSEKTKEERDQILQEFTLTFEKYNIPEAVTTLTQK